MNNRRQQYKEKSAGFADVGNRRLVRTAKHEELRKAKRDKNFAKNRDVSRVQQIQESTPNTPDIPAKLKRWKMERETKRKMDTQPKKPAFKVGIVHHKFYSPPVSVKPPRNLHASNVSRATTTQAVKPASTAKGITKATQKRLEAKLAAPATSSVRPKTRPPVQHKSVQRKPVQKSVQQLISPEAESQNSSIESFNLRLSSDDENYKDNSNVREDAETHASCITKVDEAEKTKIENEATSNFDTTEDLKASETDGSGTCNLSIISKTIENELKTPPSSNNFFPAALSPYIVSSRGKSSARKEQKAKMRCSLSNDIPTKETVMQNLNISIEEEERTAQYFKFILEGEVSRLTNLCKKWEAVMNDPDLPEDAHYQINQAVGQTNLLLKKKFERFRSLVQDCETGKGEALVCCRDLQGFWDMTYMEVKNCDARFLKLDSLQSKSWIEEEVPAESKKVVKKKIVPAKPKVKAKSSARSWILEARKKKMSETMEKEASEDALIAEKHSDVPKSTATTRPMANSRRSVRLSPPLESQNPSMPKATPRKTPLSLLKKVQISEASKKPLRSPLVVMKVSQMCKTPEVKLDDSISYINSDQTPAKGILKKSEDSSSSESTSRLKSTRKVDFNDDVFVEEVKVENELSEEVQNSIDLGRALARIDRLYDDDDEYNVVPDFSLRNVEKRLDFENESFDENDDKGVVESATVIEDIPEAASIPIISIIPQTPKESGMEVDNASLKANWRSWRKPNKSGEISSDEESPVERSFSVKVLRNRTVVAETPNRSSRRSIMSTTLDRHDHLLNSSSKENSDPLRGCKSGLKGEAHKNREGSPKEQIRTRRSVRKSIRTNVDDCAACTPKPSRVRQSRNVSLLGDNVSLPPTPAGV